MLFCRISRLDSMTVCSFAHIRSHLHYAIFNSSACLWNGPTCLNVLSCFKPYMNFAASYSRICMTPVPHWELFSYIFYLKNQICNRAAATNFPKCSSRNVLSKWKFQLCASCTLYKLSFSLLHHSFFPNQVFTKLIGSLHCLISCHSLSQR